MAIDITIPEMGESVRTGVVARWLKNDGDAVAKDQVVMELETDKITAEITAPVAGRLRHSVKVGDTVPVGSAVGRIEEGAGSAAPAAVAEPKTPAAAAAAPAAKAASPAAPLTGNGHSSATESVRATPLAEKIAKESGVDLSKLQGTGPGGRIREQDVTGFIQARPPTTAAVSHAAPATKPNVPTAKTTGGSRRERISPLRARIAERLVHAQHTAAMLTTFNEVDMTNVTALRKKFKDEFEKKHGIGLGFMSFFVKAAANALKQFPVVNAYLAQSAEGALEVEYHDYVNISVAVSTPKGLTVPVLRNVESMTFAQVELAIKDLAERARDGKLTLDDLQGGTFTVSNGGIFGSLMSTPILNAPQTAILGMHGIKNRPVEHPEKPGEIALRPMMYLAMSYDHRLLDGQESVRFLVAIKNAIENPDRLLLDL